MHKASITRTIVAVGAASVALLASGCAWVGLTWGALTYPTSAAGESSNVVAVGNHAYIARGAAGIEILALGAVRGSTLLALPVGMDSADDLAVADDLLFVLDAQPPGHLGVWTLADPESPRLATRPVAVEVGPFSGVAAAAGRVIVSGGTSRLSLRHYDRAGQFGSESASADFGRGQPDVLLDPRGELAIVSTHDWGPHFSLTLARASLQPLAMTALGRASLDSYGFTPGGARPANFPIETAVSGSHVYVASAAGLSVIDVATPAQPRLLAALPLEVQAVNVDVLDGIAAIVGSRPSPRLVLVDVRDGARPQVLQSFPLPEGSLATGVAMTASHVVVAAHGRGSLLLNRAQRAWEQVQHPSPLVTPQES